ncbi:hypothetical protein ACHAXT_012277 [Thalassiosira profunda]
MPPNTQAVDPPAADALAASAVVTGLAGEPPSKRIKSSDDVAAAGPPAHVVSSSSASSRAPSPADGAATATARCLRLLFAPLPTSLASHPAPKAAQVDASIASFRALWTGHGFRTSAVTSPRPAVSVYLDSCAAPHPSDDELGQEREEGRTFLTFCVGMHQEQMQLEVEYATLKNIYWLVLFLRRMRLVRKGDMEDERVKGIVAQWEEGVEELMLMVSGKETDSGNLQELAKSSPRVLSKLLATLTDIDHSLRADQLLHEYNRISYEHCTLANACLRRWLDGDDMGDAKPRYDLEDVYYKSSPPGRYLPKYERITMHVKDPDAVEPSKGKLIFLPSLTKVLTSKSTDAANHPLDAVADDMIVSTWEELLRNGYYVDTIRKESLGPVLRDFYLSGLRAGKDSNMPIPLNAHFSPTRPLSLYLHGTAGAGKSSLVRSLLPALNTSIATHCDPALLVRFVKQNLNKPFNTLQLELELRPNNNDYSVMSIIQGRRMTLSQSKPGLVLVALEEMPSDVEGADPKQGDVGSLISMRFSGRRGELKIGDTGKEAPRNSAKRGISGDATIISIFTSNYDLEAPCKEALQRLQMFQHLTVVKVAPVAGEDRMGFASSYLMQLVEASLGPLWTGKINLKLVIPCGEGDIRPLVRYLRMLSFYIHAVVLKSKSDAGSVSVSVAFDTSTDITTIATDSGETMQLKPGSFQNLYAIEPPKLDARASNTVAELSQLHPNLQNPSELSQILDFYFAKTLAPAVVVSQNQQLIGDLVKLLAKSDGVHAISNIDPTRYKIMKSLYDATDTPNLRDDILKIVHADEEAFVASELVCHSTDAQLQIREIVEDTPSMTAFSTERSALHKDGLIFGVSVEGEITPEILSRASLVI